MRIFTRTLIIAFLGLTFAGRPLAGQQATPAPALLPLSDAVVAKLPPDWRDMAQHIKASETEQKRYLTLTDVVFRQTVARVLTRNHVADAFIKTQLVNDPAPAVRSAIVTAISNDARWNTFADTPGLIEGVAARDPDVAVSLTALELLRRNRIRETGALLTQRLAAATKRGDDPTVVARLVEAQERWISLERGTMLPAFLRTPPPVFAAKSGDGAIRVLAFGDFGNGSPEQKTVAQTIASYHRDQRFDFAVTLGDNFYSVGMESPADPRWQTWFEDLYGPLGIPFYAAFGNHDWGHPDSPAAEIMYTGKTPTWHMPAAYYTFTAGPVQFFAVDTQSIALAQKQREWLDRELSKSQARWKVVYGHHPVYSVGNYEDRPDLIASVLPILADRADVYLAGHDHNLQALPPQRGVHFYIAGGGGAGLYEVKPDPRTLFASRTNGFGVLEADNDRLVIKLVDTTGKPVYEDVIRKAPTSSVAGQPGKEKP